MQLTLTKRLSLFCLCTYFIFYTLPSMAQKDIDKVHISTWMNSSKQSIKGKYVILDFWATWCGPCIKGLIETNEIAKSYKDKILFLAISEEEIKPVKEFLSRRSFNQNFVLDSLGSTFKHFDVKGIPEVLMINPAGEVVWRGHSSNLDEKLINKFLNGELSTKTPETIPTVSKKALVAKEPAPSIDKNAQFVFNLYDKDTLYQGISELRVVDKKVFFRLRDCYLKNALLYVTNVNLTGITFSVPDSTLLKRIGLMFKSNTMTYPESREIIIKGLESYFNLNIVQKPLTKDIFLIEIDKPSKLEANATILNAKAVSNNAQKGSSAGYATIGGKQYFVGIGLTLKALSMHLSSFTPFKFSTVIDSSQKYDFEVPVESIIELTETLKNKYGIDLKPSKQDFEHYYISSK